jgi:hypothetical protein
VFDSYVVIQHDGEYDANKYEEGYISICERDRRAAAEQEEAA